MTAHPSQKALFCDRIYDFSSHTVQLAVWLLVFYGSVIPILWVSVSYITLLSSRNQAIKTPDIRTFQASHLVILGVKCKMETTITESVRQR